MSTILSACLHGKRVGRCDANCYNAKRPKCTCICEGENHGVGRQHARTNALVRAVTTHAPQLKTPPDPNTLTLILHLWPLRQTTDTSWASPQPETSAPSPSTAHEPTAPFGS